MRTEVKGILAPFGSPIPKAVIQVTSLDTNQVIKGVYLRHIVSTQGEYQFTLEDGIYLLEYKQKKEMVEVGVVYVNETTPPLVTLEELIKSSPIVTPPLPTSPDVDWDTALTVHNENAEKESEQTQAASGAAYSLDYEEASSTSQSTYARALDKVDSLNAFIEKESASFSQEGNGFAVESKTLKSGGIESQEKEGIYHDDNDEYSFTRTLTTPTSKQTHLVSYSHTIESVSTKKSTSIESSNSESKTEYTLEQNRLGELERTVQKKQTSFNHNGYSVTQEHETKVEAEYRDENSEKVLKPRLSKKTSALVIGDTNKIGFEEKAHLEVTKDNESEGGWGRKLTVYVKEAAEELFNNGFTSFKRYLVDKFYVGDLFEVDTVNNRVYVKGQLVIDNPDDFKGDTIYQVFEYSVDGVTNWHSEFSIEDLWRRHNFSTNGYIDPLGWSAPYLLQAQDGHEGDTIYIEYNYSTDKVNWHPVFIDGDIWRRERVIENGFPKGVWSEPARIKGADGIPGDTVFIEYEYSVDGLEPWHSNFSTGDHYRRERLVTNGVAGEWSEPAKLVPEKDVDYADGYDGAGMYWAQVADSDFPINWNLMRDLFYERFEKYPVAQDHFTLTTDPNNSKLATKSETRRWSGSEWIEPAMIVSGDMLVKGTVTAEHLKAKSITGEEISSSTLITAGTGNSIAGMNGYDSGVYAGWRFWAGNAEPALAPYRVDSTGKVWLVNAVVEGSVVATSGSFTGELYMDNVSNGDGLRLSPERIDIFNNGILRVRIGKL